MRRDGSSGQALNRRIGSFKLRRVGRETSSFLPMTEFVVRMDNRPGHLAALTEALADAGVNIEALAAFGLDGEGVVRLIVDDATAARRTLREAGLSAEEHQVLTAFLPHSPGQLAAVARSLADSDINIEAVYVLN